MLKVKAVKQEKTCQQENMLLADDYKHLTEQFKVFWLKFEFICLRSFKRSLDTFKWLIAKNTKKFGK